MGGQPLAGRGQVVEDADGEMAVLSAILRVGPQEVRLAVAVEQHGHRPARAVPRHLLLAALHAAGLATLTHTPSPMGFLGRVLGRPRNERPFLLIPVGYPAVGAVVPVIGKKTLDEVRTIV